MTNFRLFWMSERRYAAWLAEQAEERAIRKARLLLLVEQIIKEWGETGA